MPLFQEEKKILQYLKTHPICTYHQLVQECLPQSPSSWTQRILMNLEWLGYINVFVSPTGEPENLQITSRGMALGSGTSS